MNDLGGVSKVPAHITNRTGDEERVSEGWGTENAYTLDV